MVGEVKGGFLPRMFFAEVRAIVTPGTRFLVEIKGYDVLCTSISVFVKSFNKLKGDGEGSLSVEMTPVDAARLELKVSDAVILAYIRTCCSQWGCDCLMGMDM